MIYDNTHIETLATGLNFPEGPAFDPYGALWCVELHGGALVRWESGALERYPTGGAPNGLTVDHQGRLWFCDSGQNLIRWLDPRDSTWHCVADLSENQPLDKPNDLAFDAAGNLLFTCPGDSRREPNGYVCCLGPDGSVTRICEGLYFPNGIALVDGGQSLIVAETYRHRLWKGAWDAGRRQWRDPKAWAEVGGPIGPDGMAVGADGQLYVAVYGSGQIKVVAAAGAVTAAYALPGANPTNVAFDPNGTLGLVVTEAEHGALLSLPALGTGQPLFDGGAA